ncbi:MAG TPA: DinB family protein [Thermomicrobiales bacterium]|nr:DinB family protein [Thermomicrobiales bacterium]HRA47953.1 DinB family protein [Thermomicrobiales bacterium]
MSRSRLDVDDLLDLLNGAPGRIADLAAGCTPDQLRCRPAPDDWSANDVLAHLRACADVWGGRMELIVAEDHPTIRAINPTTWILQTDYPDLAFAESLAAFTSQRKTLLPFLRSLTPAQWERTCRLVGAGAPLEHSVHGYADALARHERTHIKQIQRTLKMVATPNQTRSS